MEKGAGGHRMALPVHISIMKIAFFINQYCIAMHMGPEDPSNRKKYPSFLLMPNFQKLQDDSKNVSLKNGSKRPKKLGTFISLFLMRKALLVVKSGP